MRETVEHRTFYTYHGAAEWISEMLREFKNDIDCNLNECRIVLLDGKWKAGISWSSNQGDMFSKDNHWMTS